MEFLCENMIDEITSILKKRNLNKIIFTKIEFGVSRYFIENENIYIYISSNLFENIVNSIKEYNNKINIVIESEESNLLKKNSKNTSRFKLMFGPGVSRKGQDEKYDDGTGTRNCRKPHKK